MPTLRVVPQREPRNRTADVLREVEAGSTVRITGNNVRALGEGCSRDGDGPRERVLWRLARRIAQEL